MMTLGLMRSNGDQVHVHCEAYHSELGRYCNTTWEPGLDQMIQYFGLDFEISAARKRFLSMFECPNCGAPASTLTYMVNAPGMHRKMRPRVER
jgi:hypothetical protein